MPATEQTWRDQKLMHVIFGVSAVVMLASTIWMFAKDHAREWKDYQKKTNEIGQWYTAARLIEAQTTDFKTKLTEANLRWDAARTSMLATDVIADFKEAAAKDEGADVDFTAIDSSLEELATLSEGAAKARADAIAATEAAQKAIDVANRAAADGLDTAEATRDAAIEAIVARDKAKTAMEASRDEAIKVREGIVGQLGDLVRAAKFREDNLARSRKFAMADQTAALSLLGLAHSQGKTDEEIAARQQNVDALKVRVDALSAEYESVNTYRKKIEGILKSLNVEVDDAKKEVDKLKADQVRLEAAIENLWNKTGRTVLGMPVLDAFDNSDLQIDQIWLPDLTINYNFSNVARFDRCITCHRSIKAAAPGSGGTVGAYEHSHPIEVELQTPTKAPAATVNDAGETVPPSLRQTYGMQLSEEGLIDPNDVTVQVVWSESIAADAGLQMGDVIEQIEGVRVLGREDALNSLLADVEWGKAIRLQVRRGLPHPYASHPRLDLYMSDASPHKMGEMGCTICHDGQGSATEFKWASHTPDDPAEAARWRREYGWFDNHHWIFPMNSKRFFESGCLKCHHEVVELEPSERFPDPPAPQLMAGYDLVRTYGCFGCHEVNGYDGPAKRIGPDLRAEPNFHAVAHTLLADISALNEPENEPERAWANRLIHHPEDDVARRRLYEAIDLDQQAAKAGGETRFDSAVHKLGALLKDVESPGKQRKVGPSLRFLASKVEYPWLYSWIRQPSDFRPTTRMPQFFGLWSHLEDHGHGDLAEKFEPIEIQGMAEYLLAASKPFEYDRVPSDVSQAPSAERGKQAFQLRGCLACHQHADFPEITANQGPDLSRIGEKLVDEKSHEWLYTWLRDPSKYHFRTKMPNLFLDSVSDKDGQISDPAADIAAFLLKVPQGQEWKPADVPSRELSKSSGQALYDLALEHLAKQYPKQQAADYLQSGVPEAMKAQIKGDEIALVGASTDENRQAKLLQYVGRRAISKYGCSGCHDIPGYEAAKPIGAGLADWGRKDSSKLAFEQIARFLEPPHADHDEAGREDEAHEDEHGGGHAHSPDHSHAGQGDEAPANGLTAADYQDRDVRHYLDAIGSHHRLGFLWQKLRQPRSYDYKMTGNKGYNERLRMPKFPFDEAEREQVMTFVLGLVAEPPAEKYIYQPDHRQEAIVAGRKVLEKYNCGGCHALDMARWEFDYHERDFRKPANIVDFPFLESHFAPDVIESSLDENQRGMRRAVVQGMPLFSEETGRPQKFDEDGVPLGEDEDDIESFYSFVLWEDALLNGMIWPAGIQNLSIRTEGLTQYPFRGGDLARYLFPVVIADEKTRNPQVKGSEAWGWLPPPLAGEGAKVRTDWLHDFLLAPYPIRPAAVMRMPKFNMSSAEATALANYFAAQDNAEYPYEYDPATSEQAVVQADLEHPGRMDDALKIVVDGNYCVKCHLVGDYTPPGSVTALGPNLADAYRRLRPGYTRDWVANPKRLLPYTGMPVNIPYKPDLPHLGGVSQELFPGTSVEQLDGLVDFLMNYDVYTRDKVSIAPLVKPAPAAVDGAQGGEGAPAEPPDN